MIKNIIYKLIFYYDFFYDGKFCYLLNFVVKWYINIFIINGVFWNYVLYFCNLW